MGLISFCFRTVSVVGVGLMLLPLGYQALRLHLVADDPPALAAVALAPMLTPERTAQEIDAALAAGDAGMAESFVTLADQRGLAVDAARREAVAAANEPSLLKSAGSFARGAVIGDVDGLTGLAGAFAGDMVGIGDVRDLGREGWKIINGEEPDRLIMGLAAAGLAVTAATWLSAGEASPVRAGMTLLKDARRTGRLSKGLTTAVTRELSLVVDMANLDKAVAKLGSFEIGEARRLAVEAVKLDKLAPLGAMARDGARIFARTDLRGVEEALALAGSAEEVGKLAKLSERLGKATRATLKLVGRGVIELAAAATTLFSWAMAALFYLWAVARGCAGFGRKLAKLRLPRKSPPTMKPPLDLFSRSERKPPGSARALRAA